MKKLFIACFIVCANVVASASTQTTTLENELRKAFREDGVGWLATVQKLFKEAGIDVYHSSPVMIIDLKKHLMLMLEELLSLKKSDGSLAININQSNADGITPLLAACEIGFNEVIEKLLAVPGIDINQANNDGETPLLVACKRKPYAVRTLLAVEGIDVNKADNNGETPLLAVCKNNVGG